MTSAPQYRALVTVEEVREAERAGLEIEITAWHEDTIDMPSWKSPGSGGWIRVFDIWGDDKIAHWIALRNKFRAPIQPANVEKVAALAAENERLREALAGCVEHMEHSTPQGRAAYEAARAALSGDGHG